MLKVLYLGDSSAGAKILERIRSAGGVELVGLGGGRETDSANAARWGLPFFPSREINRPETVDAIGRLQPGLLVNFNSTVVLSARLLALPALGAVNFHPGLLPEYAGLYTYQWAIINGEDRAGVTVHYMEEGIDTGDILASREIPVGLSDTGLTLFMKCLTQGAELVGELIPAFRDQGRLQGRKQDLARRGYYGQDAPYRGVASFAWSPRQVTDFVRALSYRPFQSPTSAPYTFWRGRPLELGAPLRPAEPGSGGAPGEVLEAAEDRLVCAAGAGAVEVGKLDAGQGLEPGGLAARRLGLRPGDRLGR